MSPFGEKSSGPLITDLQKSHLVSRVVWVRPCFWAPSALSSAGHTLSLWPPAAPRGPLQAKTPLHVQLIVSALYTKVQNSGKLIKNGRRAATAAPSQMIKRWYLALCTRRARTRVPLTNLPLQRSQLLLLLTALASQLALQKPEHRTRIRHKSNRIKVKRKLCPLEAKGMEGWLTCWPPVRHRKHVPSPLLSS